MCNKHPNDLSDSIGVCASCLRERLCALVVAQAEAQARAQLHDDRHTRQRDTPPPLPPPPPLVFPRSVSPYVSRRKSDTASWMHHQHSNVQCFSDQRFFRTPQVGPDGSVIVAGSLNRKKHGRFSIFSHLFGSKSKKVDSDPKDSDRRDSRAASASSSPLWYSNMLYSRRKNQSRLSSLSESTTESNHKACQNQHRGMYQDGYSDDEEEEEEEEEEGVYQHCGVSSGYLSESSQGWKQTPKRSTKRCDGRRAGKESYSRSISGLAFCLSPLVRASPNRQWKQKADVAAFSGEIRVPSKPHYNHVANATSFCKSGSRKLVDLGKLAYNR